LLLFSIEFHHGNVWMKFMFKWFWNRLHFFVVVEREKIFGCLILMLHVVGRYMDSLLIILQVIVIIFQFPKGFYVHIPSRMF
jgi:hypothetical protein